MTVDTLFTVLEIVTMFWRVRSESHNFRNSPNMLWHEHVTVLVLLSLNAPLCYLSSTELLRYYKLRLGS